MGQITIYVCDVCKKQFPDGEWSSPTSKMNIIFGDDTDIITTCYNADLCGSCYKIVYDQLVEIVSSGFDFTGIMILDRRNKVKKL